MMGDYCTDPLGFCILESFFCFSPTVLLLLMSFISLEKLKQRSKIESLSKPSVKPLFLLKLLLGITNIALNIIYLALYLTETDEDRRMIVITLEFSLYIFNAIMFLALFVFECLKTGKTSKYLRIYNLMIALAGIVKVCSTDLNRTINTEFSNIEIVYYCSILTCLALGFTIRLTNKPTFGNCSLSNPLIMSLKEGERMENSDVDIHHKETNEVCHEEVRKKQQPNKKEQEEEKKVSSFTQETIEYPAKFKEGDKVQLNIPIDNQFPSSDSEPDRDKVFRNEVETSVSVIELEDLFIADSLIGIREGKSIVLYKIKFRREGSKSRDYEEINRSFSEFSNLFHDLVEAHEDIMFPQFPQAVPEQDEDDEDVVRFRKNELNYFLSFLVNERLLNSHVLNFLMPNRKHYGREDRLNTYVSENNTVKRRQVVEPMSFSEPNSLNKSSIQASPMTQNDSNPQDEMPDFKDRTMSKSNFTVEIFEKFVKHVERRDSNRTSRSKSNLKYTSHIFYNIKVMELHFMWSKVIVRRFSEFKALHKELLALNKPLPELPTKKLISQRIAAKSSDLSGVPTLDKFDANLLDMRQEILQKYLTKILNDSNFNKMPLLRNFVELEF